jgi:hypothetical protein
MHSWLPETTINIAHNVNGSCDVTSCHLYGLWNPIYAHSILKSQCRLTTQSLRENRVLYMMGCSSQLASWRRWRTTRHFTKHWRPNAAHTRAGTWTLYLNGSFLVIYNNLSATDNTLATAELMRQLFFASFAIAALAYKTTMWGTMKAVYYEGKIRLFLQKAIITCQK